MTRAQAARLACFLLFAASMPLLLWQTRLSLPLLTVTVLAAFVISTLAGEWLFKRLASSEEQRADLEDRVRNPPLG